MNSPSSLRCGLSLFSKILPHKLGRLLSSPSIQSPDAKVKLLPIIRYGPGLLYKLRRNVLCRPSSDVYNRCVDLGVFHFRGAGLARSRRSNGYSRPTAAGAAVCTVAVSHSHTTNETTTTGTPHRQARQPMACGAPPLNPLAVSFSPTLCVLNSPPLKPLAESVSPTLYVLNASSLAKTHAIEHLTTDLTGYSADIGLICETRWKKHHSSGTYSVEGYSLFRLDREGRRGGGVAIYAR